METRKISETLEAAADLIVKHGWGQGGFGPEGVVSEDWGGGCECTFLAIDFVAGGGDVGALVSADSSKFMLDYLGLGTLNDGYIWNDAPERTAEEVIGKLREAAAEARECGL